MRDIMCSGYVAGGNTAFFGEEAARKNKGVYTPEGVQQAIENRLAFQDDSQGEYESMLAFCAPYLDGSKRDQVISITERLLPWEVTGSSKHYFPGGQNGFDAYRAAFRLDTIHYGEDVRASENMEFISQGAPCTRPRHHSTHTGTAPTHRNSGGRPSPAHTNVNAASFLQSVNHESTLHSTAPHIGTRSVSSASLTTRCRAAGSMNNGLCFVGPHRKFNPFSNNYHQLVPGQGHFGPDAIPGVRATPSLTLSLSSCTFVTQLFGRCIEACQADFFKRDGCCSGRVARR